MPLQATGLTHGFVPGEPVFTDLDLRIDPGVPTALIGPNGAGKTTLLRCFARLIDPDAGEISIDGEQLRALSQRDVARRISVVPQARPVAFAFSAMEFTMMGRHAHGGRFSLDGADQRDRALAALDAMGVAHLAERSMTELSGGEAQRVVMARTIASDAPYWLLDEPTANLDVAHRIAVLRTVRRRCCEEGGAALAVVHDLNVLDGWFERVLVLADGAVAADGAPSTVLTPTLFERVFGIRMRRLDDDGGSAWIPM